MVWVCMPLHTKTSVSANGERGENIRNTVFLMFLLFSISRLVDITSRECKLITDIVLKAFQQLF